MISISNNTLLKDNKEIYSASGRIHIAHIFNEKILFLHDTSFLMPQGPELRRDKIVKSEEDLKSVNENVLMIDFNGNLLWKIKTPDRHFNPWTVLYTKENNFDWFVVNQDGYRYNIDIINGNISNPVFVRG
jgi:hypothetical protein